MGMTTSSSYDYNLTGTLIITEALELIGVHGVGQTISPDDQATVLRTLNIMVKAWQAEGIGLWKNVEAYLFPSYLGYSYDIGPTGDHCTTAAYKTEIATAAASGDATITVDSDDDITNGDYIGIELDDKTLQWTTVNGVPAVNVVTLTDVLTGDVSVDSHVYNYTTKIQRPTELVEARKVSSANYETPLTIFSREEYMRLSSKDSPGSVTNIYFNPLRTNAKFYVWPGCDSVKEYIKFTCRIPIEDFDVATDDPDFPQEWLMALSWNLAVLIAPKFGKKADSVLIGGAAGMLQSAKDFDHEQTSVFLRAAR
jgi:hypothetical protein